MDAQIEDLLVGDTKLWLIALQQQAGLLDDSVQGAGLTAVLQ